LAVIHWAGAVYAYGNHGHFRDVTMNRFFAFARRPFIVAAFCTVAGFAAGVVYAAAQQRMIVTPIEAVQFLPVNTAQPELAQYAIVRGDSTTGPSSMLLKFARNPGTMHVHSSGYDLVVVKGNMKHWEQGESEADAKLLTPGSYWFQPGNRPHADSCLSDECLMYVQWDGKRDTRPVK
jgi:hypothetical protein